MAYQESSYLNLLFGVSQQAPQDRQPGQLSEQENMLSDLVAGLRRRPPIKHVASIAAYGAASRTRQYNTDLGGRATSIVVDSVNGHMHIVDEVTGAQLGSFLSQSYLVAAAARDIRMVTLNDAVWILNVNSKPVLSTSPDQALYPDPRYQGYFYVVAGAYSKTYKITLTNTVTGATSDVTYTTPNGSDPSHPAQSTPEYIASALTSAMTTAGWPVTYDLAAYTTGAYVTLKSNSVQLTISSDSGSNFIRASNAQSIRDVAELPARLPAEANGFIMATGSGTVKVYYRYDDRRKVWTEDCAWSDMQVPTNMPRRLTVSGGIYSLTNPTYERRASGDSKTNPALKCLSEGVTGMAAFQGRLVLFSNEYVCMSASDNPLRWFRSTVSTIVDNDPIEVAAQGNLTAPYEWGINYNKDLVCFGKRYQGVVPGGALVTPRTANISLMTRYTVETQTEPSVAGRSVFFGAPRSQGYSGMHEMLPSTAADSQYVADDVTAHIPRYMRGPFRFSAASTTSNMLVVGTANVNELIVHQYLWSSGEKVHAAWHRWTFPHVVIDAYFSGDVLVCLFGINGTLHLCHIDLQSGAGEASATVGRLDFFREATCTVEGQLTVPAYLVAFGSDLRAFKTQGANAFLGQKVFSYTIDGSNAILDIPEALAGEKYIVGFPFQSSCVPSPPVIKDSKGVPITTSRAVLHRYAVSVYNTGQFTYNVSDEARDGVDYETTPLRLFSRQLGAGLPLVDSSTVILPARLDMTTIRLELKTDDYYDLNVRSIEYGFRFNQRFRRA